ncbi:MAG: hypothetical protein M3Y77_16880 [Actinomycetota bacterium]|nr:hypothetical protein [Actinomycetota bacterium]
MAEEVEATTGVDAEVEGSSEVSIGVLARVDAVKSVLRVGAGTACGVDEHPTAAAAAIPTSETVSDRRIVLL